MTFNILDLKVKKRRVCSKFVISTFATINYNCDFPMSSFSLCFFSHYLSPSISTLALLLQFIGDNVALVIEPTRTLPFLAAASASLQCACSLVRFDRSPPFPFFSTNQWLWCTRGWIGGMEKGLFNPCYLSPDRNGNIPTLFLPPALRQ